MRGLTLVCMLGGCFRGGSPPAEQTQQPDPPTDTVTGTNNGADNDRSRTMPAVAPSTCSTDQDCTISYAGPACCPGATCGGVVSVQAVAKFQEFCRGVDCGPPVPSSSCMGQIGMRAVCDKGACVGVQ